MTKGANDELPPPLSYRFFTYSFINIVGNRLPMPERLACIRPRFCFSRNKPRVWCKFDAPRQHNLPMCVRQAIITVSRKSSSQCGQANNYTSLTTLCRPLTTIFSTDHWQLSWRSSFFTRTFVRLFSCCRCIWWSADVHRLLFFSHTAYTRPAAIKGRQWHCRAYIYCCPTLVLSSLYVYVSCDRQTVTP